MQHCEKHVLSGAREPDYHTFWRIQKKDIWVILKIKVIEA